MKRKKPQTSKRMMSNQSGYTLSLKCRLSTRYPVDLPETSLQHPKEQKPINHSLSHRHLPFPFFFSLFTPFSPSPFHHPFTSHPHSLLCLSLFFLSWAIGLLFMASPIEDALLYKTLEPSTRPTPFEDVARNSYLGL